MWPHFSDAAVAALSQPHDPVILAQVCDTYGTVQATLEVTAGQGVEDETAAIRRTCSLTLASTDLVPSEAGDLLHPLSGNELRVYRGIQLPGATSPELAPLGVFRTSKPKITDTGDQLTIAVTGNDRSSEISRRSWSGPYGLAAGHTVPDAIKAILDSKWTGAPLTYNLYPSTLIVPPIYTFGAGDSAIQDDPFADCVTLAQSAGCELFFDRQGVVVMRPVPTANSLAVAARFAEGAGCSMIELERTLDESSFRNGVVVTGTGPVVSLGDGSFAPGPPFTVSAWSTDPLLGRDGTLGERPKKITDQVVASVDDAQVMADAQLQLILSILDETAFQAAENPLLDAGDTVFLARARARVSGNYVISAVTHSLDPAGGMQVTNRGFLASAVPV